jgi:hypothetical protein
MGNHNITMAAHSSLPRKNINVKRVTSADKMASSFRRAGRASDWERPEEAVASGRATNWPESTVAGRQCDPHARV